MPRLTCLKFNRGYKQLGALDRVTPEKPAKSGKAGCQINNQIRTLRFHHDEMTQQVLAQRIGVTRQTVNAIEGGKYFPSLEVAFRIAEVFNQPLEDVFQYVSDND